MPTPIATRSTVFFGWTQADLEELLALFITQQKESGLDYVTSAAVGGKSASNGQRMSLRDWMRELKQALRELDPDTYGKRRGRISQAVVMWPFSK